MNWTVPPRLFITVIVLSLLAAACGGADPTATPRPAPTATPAPPTATASRPAATVAPQPTATIAPRAASPTARPAATAVQPTATAARPAATPTAAPAPSPTAAPVPAGTLRFASGSFRSFSMLPESTSNRLWQDPVYDYILGTTGAGAADQSGLVTTFQSSPDAKTWTFQLRKGVVFHNGATATSGDVKATLAFHGRPESTVTGSDVLKDKVTITTPDESSFAVQLTNANFFFALQFLSPMATGPTGFLLPKDYLASAGPDGFAKAGVGSGPYKFKGATPGSKLEYEALDRHWFYGVPRYKTMEFLLIQEETVRTTLLRNGGADVAEVARSKGGDLRKSGFNVFIKEGSAVSSVFIHQQHTQFPGGNPLANVKVRQALNLAVDRPTIVATFLHGLAAATIDYPVVSWDPAYKKLPLPKYDPAAAKKLLAEAGYPNGFEVDMAIYPFAGIPEGPEIMEAIAVWWEDIGIKITRLPQDFQKFRDAWFNQALKKPTVSGVIAIANRTPAVGLGAASRAGASRLFEDEELEKLGLRWAAAANLQDYVAAGQAVAQKYQLEQWRVVTLFEAGETFAVNPKVTAAWDMGKSAYSIRIHLLALGRTQ